MSILRDATQAAMMLYGRTNDEYRNELLQVKVFALVSGDAYRSHGDQVFCYDDGAWVRTDSIAATTQEWLLKVLRPANRVSFPWRI